jgi:hypothetical protein
VTGLNPPSTFHVGEMIWSRNKNVAFNDKIMPKSTDYAASDHELCPRILNPPEPRESYYLVQDASHGVFLPRSRVP